MEEIDKMMAEMLSALLVEDNPGDARLIREAFREVSSHQVRLVQAENLEEAITQTRMARFDVILLDLSLPDSDGIASVIAMRNEAPNTPIVVLTGHDDQNLAIRALREGAQDYLVKGHVDGDLLVRAMRYATERSRSVNAHKLLEDRLRQTTKMEAVGRLAGGIAHDFNNLLTIIIGASEIGQELLPAGDPVNELLGEIRKAGERAASLTGQLLAFSRKQVLQPRILDLNTEIQGMESMLRRVIGEDVRLCFALHETPLKIRVDPGQLAQVLARSSTSNRQA